MKSKFNVSTTATLLTFMLLVFSNLNSTAQSSGDFRSRATGNWGDYTTWSRYNGSSWQNATSGQIPTSTSAVTLQSNYNVTVDVSANCASLSIQAGAFPVALTISSTNALTITNAFIISQATEDSKNQVVSVGTGTLTCGSILMAASTKATTATISVSTGALIVTGNITQNASTIITATSTASIKVGGSWTIGSGTFNKGSSTVELTGVDQTISALNFYNLKVNGGGNKTLSGNVSVSNNLDLTNGNIISATSKLLTMNNGATISGGSSSSMVVGPMKRIGSGASPFNVIFPIAGKNGTYAPVTLKHAEASNTLGFTVSYNGVAHSNRTSLSLPVVAVSNVEYWDITPTSLPLPGTNATTGITMTLSYNSGDANTKYFGGSLSNFRIGHYNSTTASWEQANTSNVVTTTANGSTVYSGAITMNGIKNFSPFTTVSIDAAALPVILTNFSAKAGLNNTVNLAWATSTEIVNKGFRIERQSAIGNGKFENIGFVASKAAEGGNSSVDLYYSFVDAAPASNATNYYRLAQVDLDGKTTYSDVKLVRIGGETVTMVYPNPSNGAINISRSANASKMNVQILDMSGRMVQQYSNVTYANFKININKAGMYNIKMINAATGEQSVQRIVVQK